MWVRLSRAKLLLVLGRAPYFLLTLAAVIAACGDGSSPLARDPDGGAGGVGGGGGSEATSTTSTGQGGVGGVVEPPGPTTVTLVNGIVDDDAVRFCFRPFPSADTGLLPWPGPTGLGYARAGVLDSITSVIPAGSDVEAFVVGGALEQVGAANCDQLIDNAPAGVLVRSMGVLPQSALEAERSLLFVASGCLGGPGHEDENDDLICGVGYDPSFGNASLVAGFMSRISRSNGVAMQFVQASQGTTTYDLRLRPTLEGAATLVVPSWSVGSIAPFPPYSSLSRSAFLSPAQTQVGFFATNNSTTGIFEQSWGDIFANGTLDLNAVDDGDNLVFIAVGPAAPIQASDWWNGITFTVVAGDPE